MDGLPVGRSLHIKKMEMQKWLGSAVHGEGFWTVDGVPTAVHIQAIFYGFSDNPERLELWVRRNYNLRDLLGEDTRGTESEAEIGCGLEDNLEESIFN
jgi:hypothetical protein